MKLILNNSLLSVATALTLPGRRHSLYRIVMDDNIYMDKDGNNVE
jgi:hypothetical protein